MSSVGKFRRELLPPPLTYFKSEGVKLFGAGTWRSARCPFHDDHVPSLRIHMPDGGFNCHGCGAKGGDVLDFHRRRYDLGFRRAALDLGAWDFVGDVSRSTDHRIHEQAGDPVKLAARRHAERALGKGFNAEALHTYCDQNANPLYWVIRARDLRTGKKWIRPMRRDGSRYVLGRPTFETGTPLYGLEILASRTDETILVCEGEKCADALRKRGVLAITSGGATSADGADWTPISERRVLIWPDHDEPGQRYSMDVKHRLVELGCEVQVIDSALLGLEGEDAVDWLKVHPEATDEAILRLPQQSTHNTYSSVPVAVSARHNDVDVIVRWSAERCILNSRVWGGIAALYRDLCEWSGPNNAIAPVEFSRLLAEMGMEVNGRYVKGIALASDFEGWECLAD